MGKIEYYDIVVRFVPHYGYLPIVIAYDEKHSSEEVYRGEFKKTSDDAFKRANEVASKLIIR